MNSLCVTAFVFGSSFQSYIPLFIYSLKKSYPDCYPIVYVQGALLSNIAKQLEILNSLGKFKVVENFYNDVELNNQRGKAVRWTVWDDEFHEYKALYYADIDIFYVREEPSLFQQHLEHCNLLNIPVSNVRRKPIVINPYHPLTFLRSAKNNTPSYAIKRLFKGIKHDNRITGLHFVLPKEYYQRVGPLLPKYRDIIFNKIKFDTHLLGFTNEAFLLDLMNECEWGKSIPLAENDLVMMEPASKGNKSFRPHHGIHLSIFKSGTYDENTRNLLNSETYRSYYNKMSELRNDLMFKELETFFTDEIKALLAGADSYYQTICD